MIAHGHKPPSIQRHQLIFGYEVKTFGAALIHAFTVPFKFPHQFLSVTPVPVLQVCEHCIDADGYRPATGEFVWFCDAKELPEVRIFTEVNGEACGSTDRIVWSSHRGITYRKTISVYGKRTDGLFSWQQLIMDNQRIKIGRECIDSYSHGKGFWTWNPRHPSFVKFIDQLAGYYTADAMDNLDPWTVPKKYRTGLGFPEELELPA
jgi:hypothetical protein